MKSIEEQIKELKQFKRTNYIFSRKRIDRGDGKKTIGWILTDSKNNLTFENKDYIILHNKKLLLENM